MIDIFVRLGAFLGTQTVATLGLCILACLSVAIIMRFFIKPILSNLDEYIVFEENPTKKYCIYNTVKSFAYTAVAFVLTAIALGMLMQVCKFPCNNSPFLAWVYYVPMVALQYFLDKNMKRLADRVFGFKSAESEDEEEPAPKAKKPKVYTKKIKYTVDADGNEVALDD